MIQRIQTIWLLLAGIAAFLLTRIPLYKGSLPGEAEKFFATTDSLVLFVLAAVAGLLAVFSIFLFKNRKRQLGLAWFGFLASLLFIGGEVWQTTAFKDEFAPAQMSGTYYWGALLPFAMAVFFVLAIVNIRKDEKLVKSLDRFR